MLASWSLAGSFMSATRIASARSDISWTRVTVSRSFCLIPMSGSLAVSTLKFGGKISMSRGEDAPLHPLAEPQSLDHFLAVDLGARLEGGLGPAQLEGQVGEVSSADAELVGLVVERLEYPLRRPGPEALLIGACW